VFLHEVITFHCLVIVVSLKIQDTALDKGKKQQLNPNESIISIGYNEPHIFIALTDTHALVMYFSSNESISYLLV
jgi:hypothetical protein